MINQPLIAIVGRPNVGKSTFFNRVLKTRKAIVDAQEGITRDRIYGTMDWVGHHLTFVDTGGYIPEDIDIFNAAVRRQAQMAIEEANLILFMADGTEHPTSSDVALAKFVRESGKPHILVVNKCDSLEHDEQLIHFYELGIESLLPISALSGRLTGDLLDAVIDKLKLNIGDTEERGEELLHLAVVGMPNVGKSSLTNALLQKEQTIVTPIAGTTRDSIDTRMRWYNKDVMIVDTAGMRKKAKVKENIEFYSNVRALQSIERSDVSLVLIDALKGMGKQDKMIVDHVIKKKKGMVFIVNKWDLVIKDSNTMQEFKEEMVYQFKSLEHYPLLFVSAITKQRVSKIMDTVWNVYQNRQQKFSTRQLNDWLERATGQNPPPAPQGKGLKIKFIIQVHSAPPIIALFCNYPKLVPVAYQRYLENHFREYFTMDGVPLTLSFRAK